LESRDREVIGEFRARQGTVGGALATTRMLLLHHQGAKSGAERVTPLAWWPAGDGAVAVFASNYGAPRHPGWYHNLVANPDTTVEIGHDTWPARARVANPDERRLLLGRITAETPSVTAAIRNTRREIPLVVLELGNSTR
jgi:deazaflavin-dependent oxidoreductase (nitroreductase family)